ncbi:MAG: Hsp20/alpha crystallin family protein [Candidatus Aenigmatarchaeota archaeon]
MTEKFYWEKGDEKGISIDIPGFKKDEIKVKLAENMLIISASKKGAKEESGKNFYKAEAFSSSFSKSIALPAKINPGDYQIEIKDGKIVLKRKKKIEKPV